MEAGTHGDRGKIREKMDKLAREMSGMEHLKYLDKKLRVLNMRCAEWDNQQ